MEKIILPLSQKSSKDSIVISSKISLYRNIDGLSFPDKLSAVQKEQISLEIAKILDNLNDFLLEPHDISSLTLEQKQHLQSNLVITYKFIQKNGQLYYSQKNGQIILLINEEAHFTCFSIEYGSKLKDMVQRLLNLAASIEEQVHFAYTHDLGYLTSNLSHIGNGLNVSILLNLSGLELLGKLPSLQEVCQESNYHLKPLSSIPNCKFFYLKSQSAFGASEVQQMAQLLEFIKKIEDLELSARKELFSKIEDQEFITAYALQLYNKSDLSYGEALEFIALVDIMKTYKINDKELWYSQIFRLQDTAELFQNISEKNEINDYRAKSLRQVFLNIVRSK